MAQNAYSSTSVNYSSTVGKNKSKRVHYKDEGDDDGYRTQSGKHIGKDEEEEYTFYPAFCFPASPTHFTWVKMCIADIHRLQARKGFEGTISFFWDKTNKIRVDLTSGLIVQVRIYTSTRTIRFSSSV